jgi:hypothetical protein
MKIMVKEETNKLKTINAALVPPPPDEQDESSEGFAALEESKDDESNNDEVVPHMAQQQLQHWPEPLQPLCFHPPLEVLLPHPAQYVGGVQVSIIATDMVSRITGNMKRKRGECSHDKVRGSHGIARDVSGTMESMQLHVVVEH